MTAFRPLFSAAVMAAALSLGAPVLAQSSDANALFVEAVQTLSAAPAEGDARIEALARVSSALDRIVAEHPSSDLAVKIISGQKIGNIDPGGIKAELASLREAEAAAEAAATEEARQATLPLLERDPPNPRSRADREACVADLDCSMLAGYHVLKPHLSGNTRERSVVGPNLGRIGRLLIVSGRTGPNLDIVLNDLATANIHENDVLSAALDIFETLAGVEPAETVAPRLAAFVTQHAGEPPTGETGRPLAERILRGIVSTQASIAGPKVFDEWSAVLDTAGIPRDGERGYDAQIERLGTVGDRLDKFMKDVEDEELEPRFRQNAAREALNLAVLTGDPRADRLLDFFLEDAEANDPDRYAGYSRLRALIATGRMDDAVTQASRMPVREMFDAGFVERLLILAAKVDHAAFRETALERARSFLDQAKPRQRSEIAEVSRLKLLLQALEMRMAAG